MIGWIFPILFLYGLAVGSFLNVCIFRIPRGSSLLAGSRCPACGRPIRFYDNVPLVSYLVLRGRCRDCKASIPIRYILVEFATGLLFMATFWRFETWVPWALNTLFLCAVLVLMLIDYDHKILPNVITLPGTVVGCLASPFQELDFYKEPFSLWVASHAGSQVAQNVLLAYTGSLLGILFGSGLLWLVAELYYRAKKVEGLGFGDVKMMAMVGAFIGWKFALLTIFFGSISGSVVGLALIKFQNRDAQFQMPFGTFLGLGTIASVFVGQSVLRWYLGLY